MDGVENNLKIVTAICNAAKQDTDTTMAALECHTQTEHEHAECIGTLAKDIQAFAVTPALVSTVEERLKALDGMAHRVTMLEEFTQVGLSQSTKS